MIDRVCEVEVGTHPLPYWRNNNPAGVQIIVCSRHRAQYEEREDEFGPFDWELFDASEKISSDKGEVEHRNVFEQESEVNTTCSVQKPTGWGLRAKCTFPAGHEPPHSWVPN